MRLMLHLAAIAFSAMVLMTPPWEGSIANAGETLNQVKERGALLCGVGNNDPGFARLSIEGNWSGFDVDFCRAIATAVLDDPDAVDFVSLDSLNRLGVLQNGDVDVLLRTTTWTGLTRKKWRDFLLN